MWNLLKSAFNYIFTLFTKVGTIKAIVFTAIYWLLTALYAAAQALLSAYNFSSISSAFGSLPNDFKFYLVLFKIDVGLPIIIAAYVARFAIRRLPFIG